MVPRHAFVENPIHFATNQITQEFENPINDFSNYYLQPLHAIDGCRLSEEEKVLESGF
jgi:hypothetical protein